MSYDTPRRSPTSTNTNFVSSDETRNYLQNCILCAICGNYITPNNQQLSFALSNIIVCHNDIHHLHTQQIRNLGYQVHVQENIEDDDYYDSDEDSLNSEDDDEDELGPPPLYNPVLVREEAHYNSNTNSENVNDNSQRTNIPPRD